jgi:hypothetical protein
LFEPVALRGASYGGNQKCPQALFLKRQGNREGVLHVSWRTGRLCANLLADRKRRNFCLLSLIGLPLHKVFSHLTCVSAEGENMATHGRKVYDVKREFW